jgi:demethylmenaquinone methyltransferase/2-methoxy-6-polyprenyl-1,4-benzoquinol methylase
MANLEPQPLPSERPHPLLPAYYDSEAQRRGFVRRLFDGTAGDYERIDNTSPSLAAGGPAPGMQVLDVAVGTARTREALAIVGEAGG